MIVKKEIKIRGMDARTLVVLDELAAARHLSRNNLIRKILEKYAIAPELQAQQEKSDSVLLHVAQILEENTHLQQEIMRLQEKLLHMMQERKSKVGGTRD